MRLAQFCHLLLTFVSLLAHFFLTFWDSVYRARNAETSEAVAAKVCPFRKTKQEAVQREIEMMLMLRHPSIVRLWDVIVEDAHDRVVLIEELVTGGDMFSLVSLRGGLPEPVALHYFAQIIAGMAYCHSKGVCHRDMKLENLLLDSSRQYVKITDFGWAHDQNSLGRSMSFAGTAQGSYMAPEVRLREKKSRGDGASYDVRTSPQAS